VVSGLPELCQPAFGVTESVEQLSSIAAVRRAVDAPYEHKSAGRNYLRVESEAEEVERVETMPISSRQLVFKFPNAAKPQPMWRCCSVAPRRVAEQLGHTMRAPRAHVVE
jgi:hypothetical protein